MDCKKNFLLNSSAQGANEVKDYNWTRFYYPRGKQIHYDSYGYLEDPLDKSWYIYNPEAKTLEELTNIPCLILLGEPGIGKSYVLKKEYDKLKHNGINAELIQLRNCTENKLERKLEKVKIEIKKYKEDIFYLFLDDLDECQLRIDNISDILIDELKNFPLEKLYIRIACRATEWPKAFEEELKKLWNKSLDNEFLSKIVEITFLKYISPGIIIAWEFLFIKFPQLFTRDKIQVYNLAPLRLIDVKEGARRNKLNEENFLMEISKKEVVPFASKPITLKFFLKEYKKSNKLPKEKVGIYYMGCLGLCEDSERRRESIKLRGKITEKQRFILASRIAATTKFCNKYGIWMGSNLDEVPDEDIIEQDLFGGVEIIDGQKIEASKVAFRETLDTGLFHSIGLNRISWERKPFEEYLAAYYLIHNKMKTKQIMNLIVHPFQKKLIPQLHEVSAWLASMNSDIFKEIMEIEPLVLFRGDLAQRADIEKEELLKKILDYYEKEQLPEKSELREYYWKLKHKNLSAQLRPHLLNIENKIIRKMAIVISGACDLKDLQNDLLSIILNPLEDIEIRETSAYILLYIGNKETKEKLKPLAIKGVGKDPDDQLKGIALKANWPQNISAKELFKNLTLQKKGKGEYYRFISKDIFKHLTVKDFPIALEWVLNIKGENLIISCNKKTDFMILCSMKNITYAPLLKTLFRIIKGYYLSSYKSEPFCELITDIISGAFDHSEDKEIFNYLFEIILLKIKKWSFLNYISNIRSIIKTNLSENQNLRRRLLTRLVPKLSPDPGEMIDIRNTITIPNEDFYWILEQFKADEKYQLMWAYLLEEALNWNEPDAKEVNIILKLKEKYPFMEKIFSGLFRTDSLSSSYTQKIKKHYYEDRQYENELNKEDVIEKLPEDLSNNIFSNLEDIEKGEVTKWYCLVDNLSFLPEMGYSLDFFHFPDITKYATWSLLSESTKNKILYAAKNFIFKKNIQSDKLGDLDWAGYNALLLLKNYSSKINLPYWIWVKWLPVIINYPWAIDTIETYSNFLEIFYIKTKKEFINNFIMLLEKEDKKEVNCTETLIRGLKNCWDENLCNELFAFIRSHPNLKSKTITPVLKELLKRNIDGARDFAEFKLRLACSLDKEELNKAVGAASLLLMYPEKNILSKVWQQKRNENFINKVIFKLRKDLSEPGEYEKFFSKHSTKNMAEIYLYLYREHGVTEYFSSQFRSDILRYLKKSGTEEAVEALKYLKTELGDESSYWLNKIIMEAQENYTIKTWVPPSPKEFIELIKNEKMRYIQTEEQLLNLIIEALENLEKKLHGESPRIKDLWNEGDKNRPKKENDFSDYLKRFLEEELIEKNIIINREVQIRKEKKTDLYVQASYADIDTITVIIEVKGCWNKELNNAMEEQLIKRYLEDYDKSHTGLYLVGWFKCNEWDKKDTRKKDARRLTEETIEKEREKFDKQAEKLSKKYNLNIKAFVLNAVLK